MAITSSDVPTACFIGARAISTSAGTTRKPPPMPTMPGQRTHADSRREDQRQRRALGVGSCLATPAEHGDRRAEHDHAEDGELQLAAQEAREPRPAVRAGHRYDAEQRSDPEVHVPCPPVADRTDQARDAHHGQRHGDCRLGAETQHVDEDRHREDGAAAAEQAER